MKLADGDVAMPREAILEKRHDRFVADPGRECRRGCDTDEATAARGPAPPRRDAASPRRRSSTPGRARRPRGAGWRSPPSAAGCPMRRGCNARARRRSAARPPAQAGSSDSDDDGSGEDAHERLLPGASAWPAHIRRGTGTHDANARARTARCKLHVGRRRSGRAAFREERHAGTTHIARSLVVTAAVAIGGHGRARASRLERLRDGQAAAPRRRHQGGGLRASPRLRAPRSARQGLERGAGAAFAHGEPRPSAGRAPARREGDGRRLCRPGTIPIEMRAERITIDGKTIELR